MADESRVFGYLRAYDIYNTNMIRKAVETLNKYYDNYTPVQYLEKTTINDKYGDYVVINFNGKYHPKHWKNLFKDIFKFAKLEGVLETIVYSEKHGEYGFTWLFDDKTYTEYKNNLMKGYTNGD